MVSRRCCLALLYWRDGNDVMLMAAALLKSDKEWGSVGCGTGLRHRATEHATLNLSQSSRESLEPWRSWLIIVRSHRDSARIVTLCELHVLP